MLLLYSLLGRYDFLCRQNLKLVFGDIILLIPSNLLRYNLFPTLYLYILNYGPFKFLSLCRCIFLSLLIEVGRKTFPISLESEANDSYSSRLGFKAAIGLCVALYLIATLSYFLSAQLYILPNILSVLLFVVISFKYINKQNVQMQKIYLVGIILLYVTLNFSFHAW